MIGRDVSPLRHIHAPLKRAYAPLQVRVQNQLPDPLRVPRFSGTNFIQQLMEVCVHFGIECGVFVRDEQAIERFRVAHHLRVEVPDFDGDDRMGRAHLHSVARILQPVACSADTGDIPARCVMGGRRDDAT